MIYTLTLNPSLDYIMELDGLKPGCMNRAARTGLVAGGKGINVSIVLDSLRCPNIMLGFIAGFTGDEIERQLMQEGHQTDFIHLTSGRSRINVKLSTEVSTEVNAPGPYVGKREQKLLEEKLDKLTAEDYLVLSGALCNGMPDYTYRELMEPLIGRGVEVIVDAAGPQLLAALGCHPFLIKPNRQELEELFSTKILLHNDVDRYARELQKLGARNVLISLDREGAVLACEDGTIIYRPAPDGEPINPVGAGDSMLAGFLYGWLENGSYENALRFGLAAGSAAAFSTGFASGEDILALKRFS